MASNQDILKAVAEGDTADLSDWSSGDTMGASVSTYEEPDAGELSSYESYLQSMEQPSEEASEEALPSDEQGESEPEGELADDPSNPLATEEITVTLENGRKAKITADYEDRNKIRKAYEMAAGMRKFQAERDQERQRIQELSGQMQELKGTWDKLEDAYQSGGVEGVIDLLEGRVGAHREYIASRLEQERLREAMSPDERAKLDLEERILADRRAQQQQERIRQKEIEEMKARLAEADEKETRALIIPAFEKYRFQGKLGDEVAEHHFDQAVWMQALSNLEQLDDDQITPDVIDREFSRVSQAFARAAKQQASTATKRAVSQKKKEAKTQAAVSAMKGMNTNSQESTLTKRLWSGDTAGVLKELLRRK